MVDRARVTRRWVGPEGRRVRALRNAAGESLAELAAAVGSTIDKIHRLETGKVRPRVELLAGIGRHYGVSFQYGEES